MTYHLKGIGKSKDIKKARNNPLPLMESSAFDKYSNPDKWAVQPDENMPEYLERICKTKPSNATKS